MVWMICLYIEDRLEQGFSETMESDSVDSGPEWKKIQIGKLKTVQNRSLNDIYVSLSSLNGKLLERRI